MTVSQTFAFALHGGAGANPAYNYDIEIEHMHELCETARVSLIKGATCLDVVCDSVRALENSGLYVAGKGASPNLDGKYELDASLMNGSDLRCGAVAALQGYKNPTDVARLIMDETPHIMLVGYGAQKFASASNSLAIEDEAAYFTHAGRFDSNHAPSALSHGTVGCVCLDSYGNLASATSTAGVFNKLSGRVGDSPIIGSGTWADKDIAVSTTGQGEYFIRVNAAFRLAIQCEAGLSMQASADDTLQRIVDLGGEGGLICLNRHGEIYMPFRSQGMKRAGFSGHDPIFSAAF